MAVWIFLSMIVLAFVLNILGLLKVIPLYITSPFLFLSLLSFFYYLNVRKRFKGFR
ncbi:hypothetical protein [Heyndrickxia acidicola]|uniref:Uncharacterized protein n=1 Tax=Heyndrickxia acidicola TaxID=209389 RepID=A0ABU6MCX8_9BACI|nr:hypothetical protein [Heyndrickxia acidicola]MED1202525.1 hypothetical protein [Heyndrickxia acidicola]